MVKRATMSDIARKAGVSQATVSLVLNGVANARVAAETRARVRAIAEDLGYARRGGALRSADVPVIALLVDDVTATPFAAPFIEGARSSAFEFGALLAVFCTGNDEDTERAALDLVRGGRLLGVLYCSLVTRLISRPFVLAGVKAVLLNCHAGDGDLPSVVPADTAGGSAATELLIRAGHRRIAHIAGEGWGEAARGRTTGYKRALASHDIAFAPELLAGPAWTAITGREATLALLDLPDPPTAIFCFSDRVALGCYEALAMRGLRVPEDVSVIGFDNDDIAATLQPALTTLVLPHDEMARWAVERLVGPQGGPLRMKIGCELIERRSVGPPRGNT